MEFSMSFRCFRTFFCDEARARITRSSGKLTRAVYAGLLACFVPSVLCQEWSRSLTFDEIYNDTNYVQLQHKARPYDLSDPSFSLEHDRRIPSFNPSLDDTRITSFSPELQHNSFNPSLEDDRRLASQSSLEDSRWNEIELEYEDSARDFVKEPLLVGFAHDPFRYSVPEEDYMKGVRSMNPKTIMNKEQYRGKRGVLHLYNMMYCATGCEPLAYKGYGCYCGFLGSGRPTDGIDRCCKMHDQCYENIYCPFFTVYFQPYFWKCYKGQPLCALENYHTQHQFINGCAARLCECDRKFAMCVKKYPCPRRRALCHSSPLRLLQNLLMFR